MVTLIVLLEMAYPLAVAYEGTHLARPAPPVAELGLPYEEVDIQASDGVTIKGWYVPSQNRAAVITYPGRQSAQRHAQFLARQGYGVLLLDRRGQGGSEGDPNSYGWDETRTLPQRSGTCTNGLRSIRSALAAWDSPSAARFCWSPLHGRWS